jgi:excinuclease ABC subunit B
MQTAGRAARHVNGRVILYADHITDAMDEMMRITNNHRERQLAYNREHGITPRSVKRAINESTYLFKADKKSKEKLHFDPSRIDKIELVSELKREMIEAADRLEFERAAYLRDQIAEIERKSASER